MVTEVTVISSESSLKQKRWAEKLIEHARLDYGFDFPLYSVEESDGHKTTAFIVQQKEVCVSVGVFKQIEQIPFPQTVSFLWTNSDYRRKGFASFLLDYACEHFDIDLHDLAWLGDYTPDGRELIKALRVGNLYR